VVTGLAPTKGIALPLLSSGGTGWLLIGGSLGLVLSVERSALRRERALGISEEHDAEEVERAAETEGRIAQEGIASA
jgi:hypothetical protein